MLIKLSVLLNAIQEMKAADALNFNTDPKLFARLLTNLCVARIGLEVALGNIKMIVEDDI